MTLYEFEALNQEEKAEAVWRGTFLADRIADGCRIQLYSLSGCYVEVFYDPQSNKITDFRAFTGNQFLVPYLAQLNPIKQN
ncbi:hypothetical protein EOD41_04235 [Mucilaginibacter limnophilus]|uniref:Uncharacterized protein n=1 Tax=Mucilaginibacter limnophilus TaxID=1932778 RepID=A0A3S2UNY2_9SPHI|nr:hypothetical protein [Mucilaginibacter limnophilus]RVU03147.1 hypothetical protein EOD41_04235 [Mucilaginibacter limnophilus]